jgi:hypothetical protein
MKFLHEPNGTITVNYFSYSLREFLIDEPAYALPPGMTGRIYEIGLQSTLLEGEIRYGGPYPWPEGDVYISKEAVYIDAHENRWYLVDGVPVDTIPADGDFSVIPKKPSDLHVWDATGFWRLKTQVEIDADKMAAINAMLDANVYNGDVMTAFAQVAMEEINLLRVKLLLEPRTLAQMKAAIFNKMANPS